jgi:hypothetical protein
MKVFHYTVLAAVVGAVFLVLHWFVLFSDLPYKGYLWLASGVFLGGFIYLTIFLGRRIRYERRTKPNSQNMRPQIQ